MYESPHSLQDVCINFICGNIGQIFIGENNPDESTIKSLLKNSDIYFPSNVSEQLLENLTRDCSITDKILLLFDEQVTRLQRVKICNASELTTKGLSVLRHHKIRHLEVQHLSKITVNDLIGCLGEWTLHNLQSLNVSHCEFVNKERIYVVVALAKLKNLCALNVSNTDFNLRSLDIVTQDLPLLETLDISETLVRDALPLKKCKEKLKHLTMYNLKIVSTTEFMSVLYDLHNLCHLDISDEVEDPFSLVMRSPSKINNLLRSTDCLPNLVSLDISGKDGISIKDLRFFLNSHTSLKFLGLMLTDVCFDNMFIRETDPNYNSELVVTGCGSEKQILEALRRYLTRRSYVQKALYYLYSYTQNFQDAPVDVIKLVLRGMEHHHKTLSIQMAATACLYNLSKGNLVHKIHPHWLKKVVDLTLSAMENFPKHQQLQKNTLLTLCSDRILQDVTFDRYRCAELVMESLVTFDDRSMNRMSVAICSVLAAKISTAETTNLGTKLTYMERLLNIVRAKTTEEELDIMMKFTLSALWNLTDESPATCSVFLNMGGMDLFLQVLKSFPGESAVEAKVLGLMNNVAEVVHLRPHLMKDEFLSRLRSLLHSVHVDVSYFAAGIVAHLASSEFELWNCSCVTRQDMLKELGDAVLRWEVPETEMVAYRSFTPFFPLLKCFTKWEIQLWAVWAIHHVSSKNPRRYCPMLVEEDVVQLILCILENPFLNSSVSNICKKILDIVKSSFSTVTLKLLTSRENTHHQCKKE